jgi:hypothetical protein
VGEYYRIGASPEGPWQDPADLQPGWAHEIWQGTSGEWFISYLTDYTITISALTWDTFFEPAHPIIGDAVYHQLLPLIYRSVPH